MAFALPPDREKELDEILTHYPEKRAACLPALWLCQKENGWVSPEVVEYVAARLELTTAQVKGVVTFYTMFRDRPTGRDMVMVCKTLSCRLRGAQDVLDALEDHFGIELGGTTEDGRFTIEAAECLGLCDMAPCMLVVDSDRYGDLTPESAVRSEKPEDSLRQSADFAPSRKRSTS